MDYTHSYIGRKPCGCLVAAMVDTSAKNQAEAEEINRTIGEWYRRGLSIERVKHETVREQFTSDANCPHKEKQPQQMTLFEDGAQS